MCEDDDAAADDDGGKTEMMHKAVANFNCKAIRCNI